MLKLKYIISCFKNSRFKSECNFTLFLILAKQFGSVGQTFETKITDHNKK